jgi:hypothetical protein
MTGSSPSFITTREDQYSFLVPNICFLISHVKAVVPSVEEVPSSMALL